MKVYQLIWVLIKKFGLFGEADIKLAQFTADTIRENVFEEFGEQVRDRYTALMNAKVPDAPIVKVTGDFAPVDGEHLQFNKQYGVSPNDLVDPVQPPIVLAINNGYR